MTERCTPDVGRWPETTEDEYLHEWDALQASMLGNIKRSPYFAKWRQDHPDVDTDARTFGTAAHCIVLEPEKFEDKYRLEPQKPPERRDVKNWRATKDYKEAKADLVANGFRVLKQSEFDGLRKIRDRLYLGERTEIRDLLLAKTATEVSYAAPHPKFENVLCKCRTDLEVAGANMVVDLKTSRDASPRAFSRDLFNYGYHRSKPFYMDVMCSEGSHKWEHHLFLVVENIEPFQCCVYSLDPGATELGRAENYALIEKWARCLETDTYPGLPTKIQPIDVPRYAYSQIDEEMTID